MFPPLSRRTDRKIRLGLACLLTTLFESRLAAADPTYLVREGDCLSVIALRLLGPPIYGKTGTLHRLLEANSEIRPSDPIFPGTTLRIPGGGELESAPPSRALSSSEPLDTPEPIAPTTAIAVEPVVQNPSGSLSVGAGFRAITLNAEDPTNGTRATLVGRRAVSADLAVIQNYSERLRSEFGFGIEKLAFDAPPTGAVSPLNWTLFRFSAAFEYRAGNRWRLMASLPISQELFITAVPASGSYSLVRMTTVAPTFAADYSVYRAPTLETSFGFQAQALLPSAASGLASDLGFGLGPRIRVRQRLGGHDGEAVFGYAWKKQNSNLTEQNLSIWSLSFRIFFNYGASRSAERNHE
jgi:hypothetical protein